MTKNITTIVFSYNNDDVIKDCIESAKLVSNNIIVIDQESNDNTVNIAKNYSAKIFIFPHQNYVEPAREFGINKASTEWVFVLDADERISPELAIEIKSVLNNRKFSYYKIPRKNIFGNPSAASGAAPDSGWLKHGGWWPDHQIRLINKNHLKTWPKEIHSTPQIEGQYGILKQPILHYFHGDFQSMVNKTIIFEDIESDLLFNADKKVTTLTFFRKFFGEIYRRLIKHLGFLDGKIGIIEAIYQAFSKTITYFFLYEKKYHKKSRAI